MARSRIMNTGEIKRAADDMARRICDQGKFPRYWSEGCEWWGRAKKGDFIGFDGHIYELIAEPCALKMKAMDPCSVVLDGHVMTEGEPLHG